MSDSSSDPRREELNDILTTMQEHYEAGRRDQGTECCRQALALLVPLTAAFPKEPELRDLLASMHYNLANGHTEKREYAEAEQKYRVALPIQQRLVREHPEEATFQNHLARCHFNLGNVFLETQRYKEGADEHHAAQKLWSALIEQEPEPEYRHDLARSCFNLGYLLECQKQSPAAQNSYRHAQTVWRKLLEEHPGEPAYEYDLARAGFNLGVSLQQTGKPHDALESLREARTLFEGLAERWPDSFEYNRDLLQTLAHTRELCKVLRLDEAGEAHDRAAELHLRMLREFGGGPETWHSLGRSHLDMTTWYRDVMGKADLAERAYLSALAVFEEMAKLHPGPDVQHAIACTLFDLGIDCRESDRPDRSEEFYRRALAIWLELARAHPDEPAYQNQLAAVHNNLGILFHDTGRQDHAEHHYRQAIALRETWLRAHPDDATIATYLGGAFCNLGNVDLVRRLFHSAHGWYERSVHLLEEVRRKHGAVGLVDPFLANARDGEKRTAGRDDKPDWRGDMAFSTMSVRPAGPPPRLLDHGIAFPDDDGLEQFVSGDYRGALKTITKRLKQHPEELASWFWNGRLHVRLGEHDAALAAFERVLELLPDHAPACHDRADVLRYLNRPAEALEAVDRLLAWDEEDPDAWHLRGLILASYLDDGEHAHESFDRERVEEAVEAFDRAILARQDFYEARLFKARTMVRLAHGVQAHWRAASSALAERMTEEQRDECLRPVGQAFHCWFRRTLESLETASRLRPKDAEPWYERGLVLTELTSGHEEEAMRAFTKATELQPELAGAWYELARLHSTRGDQPRARTALVRAVAINAGLRTQAEQDFDWFRD